jgi:hypothetical protein
MGVVVRRRTRPAVMAIEYRLLNSFRDGVAVHSAPFNRRIRIVLMAERPALRRQRTGDQRPERHQSAHLRDRGVLCELPRTLTRRGRQPMATSSPQGLSRWPVQARSSVLSSCISTRWPCSSDSWCPGFPSARRVENRRVRHGCWICSSCFPPQSVWVLSYGSHICARSQSVVDRRERHALQRQQLSRERKT